MEDFSNYLMCSFIEKESKVMESTMAHSQSKRAFMYQVVKITWSYDITPSMKVRPLVCDSMTIAWQWDCIINQINISDGNRYLCKYGQISFLGDWCLCGIVKVSQALRIVHSLGTIFFSLHAALCCFKNQRCTCSSKLHQLCWAHTYSLYKWTSILGRNSFLVTTGHKRAHKKRCSH